MISREFNLGWTFTRIYFSDGFSIIFDHLSNLYPSNVLAEQDVEAQPSICLVDQTSTQKSTGSHTLKWIYSQTSTKRPPKGFSKSGLLLQVIF